MRRSGPIELHGSVTKSWLYFRHARWKGRRQCPRCGYRLLYCILKMKDLDANVAGTVWKLTELILESFTSPLIH